MVFDWRRGHGSSYRFLGAFAVSAAFWGGIRGFVKVREGEPVNPEQNEINVTMVDLDANQYGLAELIDRKTLFQQRWDVSDPSVIDRVVQESLAATTPRIYEPTLRQISLPEPEVKLANLPGMGPDALPSPDAVASVTYATGKPNWWIKVDIVEGPAGLKPFEFPFEWLKSPSLMSEGEIWSIVLTADWRGNIVAVEGWWEKENDVRTGTILDRVRNERIEPLPEKGALRVWRLEAEVINRPAEQ